MIKKQPSIRQHRISPKRILGATVALVVAFLLLTSVIGLMEKYRVIRGRVRGLKDEQKELLVKQDLLIEKNRYIGTDEGQEYELRSKYNVVKPGEGMIIVTDPESINDINPRDSRVKRWWVSLLRGLGFHNN